MKRRELIRYLSVAPLAGGLTTVPFNPVSAASSIVKRDLIKELGLRTFINAYGVYTTHTASLMADEVMEAINGASRKYVLYNDAKFDIGK